MCLESSKFACHNVSPDFSLPEELNYFTLVAPPNTRIRRTEFSGDEKTAPMILTRLSHPLIVAEVTITAEIGIDGDQAGLILFTGPPPMQNLPSPASRRRRYHSRDNDEEESKWVKAGLEFMGGTMNASSVVATSALGGDWSLSPLLYSDALQDFCEPITLSLRIKLERIGDALWIWYRNIHASSTSGPRIPETTYAAWRKLREVEGFFCGVEMKSDIWVGCYASRPDFLAGGVWDEGFDIPASRERRGLTAEFEDLEIL